MNIDEITLMARKAGFVGFDGKNKTLCKFAALVEAKARADECEACAKVCETLWDTPNNGMATEEQSYGDTLAAAIRARGQA